MIWKSLFYSSPLVDGYVGHSLLQTLGFITTTKLISVLAQ